jgi:hypothetical protein
MRFRKLYLFPSSGEGEDTHSVAPSKGPNWVYAFPPHLKTETDSVSETLCFLVSRILDDGRSPKTQQFWVLYTIVSTL